MLDFLRSFRRGSKQITSEIILTDGSADDSGPREDSDATLWEADAADDPGMEAQSS